jgi:hypothetical protein
VMVKGSGGLNFVASIKKERMRKATSTKGVMSVAVLFLGNLTLGMFYKFCIEIQYDSIFHTTHHLYLYREAKDCVKVKPDSSIP